MKQDLALIPNWITQRGNKTFDNFLAIGVGVLLLSALGQIAISLPWTPVPITGQTFGVALTALMWGRKRAVAVMFSYLGIGALGLPVFAMGKAGIIFSPTMGYLLGMIVASYWMGFLADQGWTKSFLRTWLAAVSGSVIIFLFGVIVLSLFIPIKDLFWTGVLPFLPGDFIKNLSASWIVHRTQRSFKSIL